MNPYLPGKVLLSVSGRLNNTKLWVHSHPAVPKRVPLCVLECLHDEINQMEEMIEKGVALLQRQLLTAVGVPVTVYAGHFVCWLN